MPYITESEYLDRALELKRMTEALERIGDVASMCRADMQGRLEDETHHRAHDVLGNIAHTVSSALRP